MLAASCSRDPQPGVLRIALLPFENLTGDASLDWISSAGPSILASQLVGSPKIVPIRTGTVSDGYLAGANRFIHGNFTELRGGIRFEIEVEDSTRHRMVAVHEIRGDVLTAMDRAAHEFTPSPQPFSSSNPEAVAAWARGDEERAVALDPDFSAAWLAWAESATRRDPNEAIGIIDRAKARTLRSAIDRAQLAVLSATLHKDDVAREKALADLQRLDPSDTAVTRRLAEAENQARNFEEASRFYRLILAQEPENTTVILALGYAQSFAGDIDSARKTFEDYGKREGQKTNSLDSLGELYFMNGRFSEAEKYFLQAYDSNPAFLGGASLLKAAYARWLSGDLKGADAITARYIEIRGKARDPLIAWRSASWDFATGRRDLAMKAIAQAPRPVAQRQADAWNATSAMDLAALKNAYEHTAPSSDGLARALYAAALLKAGQKEEARKLMQRWPLPVENGVDPLLESTVFPRFIELRKALQ